MRRCSSAWNEQASIISSVLHNSHRCIVQSDKLPKPTILNKAESYKKIQKLFLNTGGRYYRKMKQNPWPSVIAMEKDMSEHLFSPVERTPLSMLPMPKRSEPKLTAEGRGARVLLEEMNREQQGVGEGVDITGPSSSSSSLSSSAPSLEEKILTELDVQGSTLASLAHAADNLVVREKLLSELQSNSPSSSSSSSASLGWSTLPRHTLDPKMRVMASRALGPTCTAAQARILSALLHEDHNDVLLNSVTGCGKTTACMLALLQSIRNETAGLNVFVAANAMNAKRFHDAVLAFVGEEGGAIVDREADDRTSWMLLAPYRDEVQRYHKALQTSATHPKSVGPCRLLITTADVMCELLFEKKMEFEKFGYLRRVYVDDCGPQLQMLPDDATPHLVRERLRDPVALEMLLGTLHQLPAAHIRSLLQIACLSADMDTAMKNHLHALCIKQEAHTTILSVATVPTTVHCLFSFHLFKQDVYAYTVQLLRAADASIPGRVILFIRKEDDILATRQRLRQLGMDAKLFSEVYDAQQQSFTTTQPWRFVLLREDEAMGIDIPHVSHVVITFAPSSRQSYLHLVGRTGRMGNLGWAYIIADLSQARAVKEMSEQLQVSFRDGVIRQDLTQIPPTEVDQMTKPLSLYGLDPQYATRQQQETLAEHVDFSYVKREFFSNPAKKDFLMEDYTPVPVLQRRFQNATRLRRDVAKNPAMVLDMQRQGYLHKNFSPTTKLQQAMDIPHHKKAGRSPFERRQGSRGGS